LVTAGGEELEMTSAGNLSLYQNRRFHLLANDGGKKRFGAREMAEIDRLRALLD
jgi:hypothetical protein